MIHTYNKQTTFDCSQDVMQEIQSRHISMKPSWIFYIGTIAMLFGVGSFTLLASLLFSLIWYQSQIMGFTRLIPFGTDGWLIFMTRLPWFAVFASFLLTLIGWWLVQHSEYGCHHRKRVIGTGIITAIFVSSLLLHRIHVWEMLSQSTSWQLVGTAPSIEEEQVLVGRIVKKNQDVYQLLHASGKVLPVRVTQLTQPASAHTPLIGDMVVVLGKWQNDIFEVDRMQIWLKETE